jgi:hypothetical protein
MKKLYYKLEISKTENKNKQLNCNVYIKSEKLYEVRLLFLRPGEDNLNTKRFKKFNKIPLEYRIKHKLENYNLLPIIMEKKIKFINNNIKGLWNVTFDSSNVHDWTASWSFENREDLILFKLKFI